MSRRLRFLGECVLVGALCMLLLALLQIGTVSAAGFPWAVRDPLEMSWFYAALGASVGLALGLTGLVGAVVRALVMRRSVEDVPRGLLFGIALVPVLLRLLASTKLHAAGWWGCLLVVSATAFAVLFVRRRTRGPQRDRQRVREALLFGFWSLLCVQLAQALALLDRPGAWGASPRGWTVVAVLVPAALVGAALSSRVGRLRSAGPGGLLLAGALIVLGAWRLHPSGTESTTVAEVPSSPPNVLLIVLDTVRRDAVSAYGAHAATTPVLDAFAARGVIWDEAVADGCWTLASHGSLFTGVPVSRHGAGHFRTRLRERPGGEDSAALPTMAELFRRRGYRTDALVCNPSLGHGRGFERGFERFVEVNEQRPNDVDVIAFLRAMVFGRHPDKGGARAVRAAAYEIEARSGHGRPWFLFLNLNEAHLPYDTAPPPFLERFVGGQPGGDLRRYMHRQVHFRTLGPSDAELAGLWACYLAAVAYQDSLLSEVFAAVAAAEASGEETVVVVTSDHGENFGWRGLLGHGQDLNDDLVRIPLIARGPALPEGRRDATPVSLIDVLPSLLSWTGGEPPPADPARRGIALTGGGRDAPADRPRVLERYPAFLEDPAEAEALAAQQGVVLDRRWLWARSGLRVGDCTYVEIDGPPEAWLGCGDGSASSDPDRIDVPADVHGEEARAAHARALRELRATWTHALEPELLEEDEDFLRKLQALGYLR